MVRDYFLNRDRIQIKYKIVNSNHPDAQQKPENAKVVDGAIAH